MAEDAGCEQLADVSSSVEAPDRLVHEKKSLSSIGFQTFPKTSKKFPFEKKKNMFGQHFWSTIGQSSLPMYVS